MNVQRNESGHYGTGGVVSTLVWAVVALVCLVLLFKLVVAIV